MFKITLDPGAEEKLKSLGLLILRVGTGSLMLFMHGWSKFLGYSNKAGDFPDPLGISPHLSLALVVFAEVVCSSAIILGIWTRLAVIPAVINMAVAVFVIHRQDPWSVKEHAALYLLPFVAIFLVGPGKYTLDRIFTKGRK